MEESNLICNSIQKRIGPVNTMNSKSEVYINILIMEIISNLDEIYLDLDFICSLTKLRAVFIEDLLKENYRMSVNRFVTCVKLELASDFLRDTSFSIKDISIFVGFDQQANFSRSFTRYFDSYPSVYREDNSSKVDSYNMDISSPISLEIYNHIVNLASKFPWFNDLITSIIDNMFNEEYNTKNSSGNGILTSHMNRKLRGVLGVSAFQLVRYFRLHKAAELLVEYNYSISSVGYMVGYFDQAHFSKTFRKIYGITPKSYREKHLLDKGVTCYFKQIESRFRGKRSTHYM